MYVLAQIFVDTVNLAVLERLGEFSLEHDLYSEDPLPEPELMRYDGR